MIIFTDRRTTVPWAKGMAKKSMEMRLIRRFQAGAGITPMRPGLSQRISSHFLPGSMRTELKSKRTITIIFAVIYEPAGGTRAIGGTRRQTPRAAPGRLGAAITCQCRSSIAGDVGPQVDDDDGRAHPEWRRQHRRGGLYPVALPLVFGRGASLVEHEGRTLAGPGLPPFCAGDFQFFSDNCLRVPGG